MTCLRKIYRTNFWLFIFVFSIYQIQKTEQHFYNVDKKTNAYTHKLRYTWRTLLKLTNTKNWITKYQRINTQPMKTKTIKYARRLRYTWRTLIKLKNTKNWSWQSTKQIWTFLNTKNWTWRNTKQTWTLLNTKIEYDGAQNRHEHYWKTGQHFYRGIQSWHEHDWKTEQHFYHGTLNRTQLHCGESNNKHTRMFASCFDKAERF